MFGQVEPTVDQDPSPLGGQVEEHPELGVLDASRSAGVLPLHSRRSPGLLQEAGLVEHGNAVSTEVFDGVGAQVIADGIGVPTGAAQQALYRTGPGAASLFGQLPTVLPLDARQKSAQVGAVRGPGFNSPEPA